MKWLSMLALGVLFGVGLGLSARSDYVIIAGHLSLHRQLPAGVARQRVEKEHGAEDGLKEVDVMIPPRDVSQFVSQHRASLRRRGPGGDVGGEEDYRAQYAEQNRRANFARKREAYLTGSQSLAIAFVAIEIGKRNATRAGPQAT